MTEQAGGLATEDLRALVREVLLDALPDAALGGVPLPGVGADTPAQAAATVHTGQWEVAVAVETDEDLMALVTQVAERCEDPAARAELRAGRVPYRLAGRSGAPAAPAVTSEPEQPVVRVDRGAVTERHVRDAAGAGARLVLGRAAVLTPLARDRARATGVDIEKER